MANSHAFTQRDNVKSAAKKIERSLCHWKQLWSFRISLVKLHARKSASNKFDKSDSRPGVCVYLYMAYICELKLKIWAFTDNCNPSGDTGSLFTSKFYSSKNTFYEVHVNVEYEFRNGESSPFLPYVWMSEWVQIELLQYFRFLSFLATSNMNIVCSCDGNGEELFKFSISNNYVTFNFVIWMDFQAKKVEVYKSEMVIQIFRFRITSN